ncbi:putative U1 small nuclear ribonucleoprotein [Cryomyces antarcticus]
MATGAAASATNSPNATVYVRNLEESIKIPDLIEALHELFDEYGTVIDLVAKKNLRAKGQAFVVFDSIEGATKAIDEVQGFELFGKGMQLDYAKTRSDAIVKRQGGDEEFEAHKRRRLAEKERKQALAATEVAKKLKRPAPGPEPPTAAKPAKAARGAGLKSTGGAGGIVPDEYLPPNKILFVRELPEDYDVEALSAIFERFPGFKEVRLVPGRKGIAFVEYEAEDGAISAKEATAGMVLGEQAITVTYQRQ